MPLSGTEYWTIIAETGRKFIARYRLQRGIPMPHNDNEK